MAAVAGALMDPTLSVSAVDVQPISESRITTITDWKHMEMLFPARSDTVCFPFLNVSLSF